MAGKSTALHLTTPSTVDFYIMHRFLELKKKKRLAMNKKSLLNKTDFFPCMKAYVYVTNTQYIFTFPQCLDLIREKSGRHLNCLIIKSSY